MDQRKSSILKYFKLIGIIGSLFLFSIPAKLADAQYAPPAYFCCTIVGKCGPAKGSGKPVGSSCACRSAHGVIQGTACY